jgi:hypothetical protein
VTADPHGLGFAGLVELGMTEAEAWQVIHDDLVSSGAMAIIAELERDEPGRAALDWSRQQWAAHGLPPPWEDR